jgi:hypothetical protein
VSARLALPTILRGCAVGLECPDKLQERCRFIVELSVKPADPWKASFREWQLALGNSALHVDAATSTTYTSS